MDETSPLIMPETTATDSPENAALPLRDLPTSSATHPEIALLLGMLDESTTHWRNEMLYIVSDQFPEGWGRVEPTVEQIVWQPFPGGHSIGALLLHMGWVEIFWLHEVGSGRPFSEEPVPLLLAPPADQEAVDAVQWPAPPAQPLSWYFAQLDAIRARTRELLQNVSPGDTHVSASTGQRLTMRWLLGYVALHDSYHGGQAVLLSISQRAKK